MKLFKKTVSLFILVLCTDSCVPKNILFTFIFTSYSHQLAVWPYLEELINLGHNVTMFTPYPPKASEENPKLKVFHAQKLQKFIEGTGTGNVLEDRFTGAVKSHQIIWPDFLHLTYATCEAVLTSPEAKRWIQDNIHSKFDLVIIDGSNNDCGFVLPHIFKCPHILFDTTVPYPWQYDIFGFLPETSWIPDFQMGFPVHMTLYQRMVNTLKPVSWHLRKKYSLFPKLEALFHREFHHFDHFQHIDFEQMYGKTKLVFTNTHFGEEFGRSLPPLYVSVGGVHIKTDKQNFSKPVVSLQEISVDVHKFVDKFEHGFVFISFGTFVTSNSMPVELLKIFFDAFSKFPKIAFVWRWDVAVPDDGIPSNILFYKWLPQQALLSHPKIKAFISHSGMLSTIESLYYEVPVIAVPVFWEQEFNAERVHRLQRGITLQLENLKEVDLHGAIQKVTEDPMYKRNTQKYSKIFKDRPMTPLKTAIYWTDYCFRHEDMSSLKPLGIHQTWYQRRLLDVWGLILIIFVAFFILFLLIVKKIVGIIVFPFLSTPVSSSSSTSSSSSLKSPVKSFNRIGGSSKGKMKRH